MSTCGNSLTFSKAPPRSSRSPSQRGSSRTRNKLLLFLTAAWLCGCTAVQIPADDPSSPASPQARESNPSGTASALHQDDTSRAIASRLRAKRTETQAPTHGTGPGPEPSPGAVHSYYTCVMHPEIHQDKPGKCPKCGMELVKKEFSR